MVKKKILFITGYFPFFQGGAEYQALLLAERLKQKMDISFVFRNYWDKETVIKDCGYTLYGINPYRIKGVSGSFVFEGRQLYKILKRIKPDIIYIRGTNAYFMIASLYSKKRNCKIIWHIASDSDVIPSQYKELLPKPFRLLDKKMVEYGLNHSDCIIGQTHHQSNLLKKNYKLKCDFVIGNWHPIPKDSEKEDSIIKIVWIANWKPVKQPEIFIRLIQALGNIPNTQPIMVGRNEQYQTLKTEASLNKIELPGEISNSEVNKLLSKSHILLNTSHLEGFNNTFIQAWMNKVPVISLQVDPDNILKRRGLGFCSGNFMQLIKDTTLLIHNHKLRQKMGNDAREYAVGHHSPNNLDKMMCIFSD